ncbi:MAG: nitrite/sulfite reductase [Pontibacterium sp.]
MIRRVLAPNRRGGKGEVLAIDHLVPLSLECGAIPIVCARLRRCLIGKQIKPFLAKEDLLSYIDAIVRVYNLKGRRDNKYKARIKILVQAMGIDAFRELVDAEWEHTKNSDLQLPAEEIQRIQDFFKPHNYDASAAEDTSLEAKLAEDSDFAAWYRQNTHDHKVDGYRAVVVSLKDHLKPKGDVTDSQMDLVADLADQYSFGEVRSTHNQNLVLADVQKGLLYELWKTLADAGLARANIGTLTDMTVCPGGDFCALANAKTLGIADEIDKKFDDLDYLYDLGEIKLNMSGCINACGHHHIGHIGILGVDRRGEDWYQITLGGSDREDTSLGKVLGKSVAGEEVADTIEKIINVYVDQRIEGERFIDCYRRIGAAPFKENVYAAAN